MTQPNVQRFVRQKWLVIVTLVGANKAEATISVGQPAARSHPRKMSIKPLLDAGLAERDALEYLADVAEIAIEAVAP